jgi:hypothetical protein
VIAFAVGVVCGLGVATVGFTAVSSYYLQRESERVMRQLEKHQQEAEEILREAEDALKKRP